MSRKTVGNDSDVLNVNVTVGNGGGEVGAMNRSLAPIGEKLLFDGLFNEVETHIEEIKHQLGAGMFLKQFEVMVREVLNAARTSKYRFQTQMKKAYEFAKSQNQLEKVVALLINLGQKGLEILAGVK